MNSSPANVDHHKLSLDQRGGAALKTHKNHDRVTGGGLFIDGRGRGRRSGWLPYETSTLIYSISSLTVQNLDPD